MPATPSSATPSSTGGGNVDPVVNLDDPICLHANDIGSVTIISFKLLGTVNYKSWATATVRALTIRNKLGFINGDCARPKEDDAKAIKWDRANAVVVSWLLASLTESISSVYQLSESACELWCELKQTYEKINGSVVFNTYQKINMHTQGSDNVSDYFNSLNGLWKEFDSLSRLSECTCDASKDRQSFYNQLKLFQFLMGLNESYSSIRSNILMHEQLPNVQSAFATISREESLKNSSCVDNGNKSQNSVFVAKGPDFKRKNGKNLNLVCKHCNMKGHTIERCYKLIGFPKDFKPRNENSSQIKSSVNTVIRDPSVSSDNDNKLAMQFTNEQVSKILGLINEKGSMGDVFANMAGISAMCAYSSVESSFGHRDWVVDSGATQHMTGSFMNFENSVDVSDLEMSVDHPNGSKAMISKIGDLKLLPTVVLKDVLFVPEFKVHLLSVHKLARDSRIGVYFNEHNCYLFNTQDLQVNPIVTTGNVMKGLYFLNNNKVSCHNSSSESVCYISKLTWHQRLGHPSDQVLKVLRNKLSLGNEVLSPCEVCHKAKQTREPFPLSNHKSSSLGELVHIDVWGPYRVSTRDGFRFFLTVVDDYTRAVWVYLLKTKEEVFENIVMFFNMLKLQFSKSVKVFRSDNGTEFVNSKMKSFFEKEGILHQTTCVYTPQQNGVVERKHRHLMNVARSLLFQSALPLNLWGETILTATFLINRTPTSVLNGKSPYEMIYGVEPNFNFLRVFGCLCFATKLNNLDKFAPRSEKCVLIGFSNLKKGYKLLSLDDKSVFFSRDVRFYESVFPLKLITSKYVYDVAESGVNHTNFFDCLYQIVPSSPSTEFPNDVSTQGSTDFIVPPSVLDGERALTTESEDRSEQNVENDNNSEGSPSLENFEPSRYVDALGAPPLGFRRSSRSSRIPSKYDDFHLEGKYRYGIERSVGYAHLDYNSACFAATLNKSFEPSCFDEAVKDPNWVRAMNEEMEALNRNGTWVITDLPKGRKPIGCRWVFKIKYKSTGEIERFKARLVAKGYNQREGLDFDETFSPVAKLTTVRCVITLAVQFNWNLYQMDVNNAFLYGELEEEVYMVLPPGYFSKDDKQVCKLVKSLYGLKQAPRKWNEKLTSSLLKFGFVQSKTDFSLYVKQNNGVFIVLLVYVDDIVLTGNNDQEIEYVKQFLKSQFLIKDLGFLKYFLGIEIVKTDYGLCLSQRKYCLELLYEFGLLAAKPIKTPLDVNVTVSSESSNGNDDLLENVTEYQKLVGKLIYLTNTRPDISFTVQTLSQFMHAPRKSHLKIAVRVLRYLKLCPGKGVLFSKSDEFLLTAWADSDWAKCVDSRRSITGYCLFLGNNLVSWKSKKQSTVSRSSTESEYRALATVTCEILWVLKLMRDLDLKYKVPVSLFCDNQSAILLSLNPVLHERTKHIEIDIHLVRDKVSEGVIKVVKVDSLQQVADIFTKPLGVTQHNFLSKKLGLYDAFPAQFEGRC
ncbi:hypothetical protein L2E82_11589 [Cichorium intybus]|uniref:Uncharacterized protein n=1 Tax=Cichorium intybus TaxID=13427 RepID=A0ACB9GFP5_CICIN|nr:hypothetical protein L2E82_11589 [Cichorium intybus]